MAAGGGGAWKVAYADFVTAMMAFFMVMWLVGQNKEVKQSVAKYFSDPMAISLVPSGASGIFPSDDRRDTPNLRGPNKKGRQHGRGNADADPSKQRDEKDKAQLPKATMFVLHGGKRTSVGTVVLFGDDALELDDDAKERLLELTPSLAGKPNKIEIRGHASGKPPGKNSTLKDPWQISYARCLATMKFLQEQGIDPQRIRLSQAGTFEPFTVRMDKELQAKNSRVEVYLLGEFTSDMIGERHEKSRDDAADKDHAGDHASPVSHDAAGH